MHKVQLEQIAKQANHKAGFISEDPRTTCVATGLALSQERVPAEAHADGMAMTMSTMVKVHRRGMTGAKTGELGRARRMGSLPLAWLGTGTGKERADERAKRRERK